MQDKPTKKAEVDPYTAESMRNWRAWGSWFSWGSPIGLTLGYAIVAVSTALAALLFSLASHVK